MHINTVKLVSLHSVLGTENNMCLMSFSVLFSLLLLSSAAESEARQREMFSQEAKFL